MEAELLNKLSGMTWRYYYNPSLNAVVVHFFNDGSKNDLMAYLLSDMSWDLREVKSELSSLLSDKEVIEINQIKIGLFNKDSSFDKFIRKGIHALFGEAVSVGAKAEEDLAIKILNNNSYAKVLLANKKDN